MKSLIVICSLIIALTTFSTENEHTGIYVIARGSTLEEAKQAASLPYIDGITLYLGVKLLMPEKGVYDWSHSDAIIKAARDNGKKVNLAFLPGRWVPEWFYTDGVKSFEWVLETNLVDPGKYDACAPIPWDSRLLELLDEMISEAGRRYAEEPAVVAVQVVGPALSNGLEAHFNVKLAEAKAVGYTKEKFINAWKTVFESTAKAFPKKNLTWCIHDMFPHGRDARPGREIRDWAFEQYGKRFHLMACYLTHEAWFKRGNQVVDIWGERNDEIFTGLQLINIYSIRKYTPDDLKQALQTGIREGAKYLEVFVEDLRVPEYATVLENIYNEWKEQRQ